jgi:hypothetical protein
LATNPVQDEPQQTTARKVAATLSAPVTERTPRIVALLALAGAFAATAPDPLGMAASAAIVVIAWEVGRKR